MEPGTAQIMIEVDVRSTPIEGAVHADDGASRQFAGYMQLITALEEAVESARARIEAPRNRPKG